MKNLFKKKFILSSLLVLTVGLLLFFPQLTEAGVKDSIAEVLTHPLIWLTSLFGKLLTVIVRLLVVVAQYNDFINSPAVSKGWIIIRDICNMFFIAVLLFIAFATVLGIEKYSYKKLLGKLLLAAVLVNFSKLICGFMIDFAQIIMLTFVNAFKEAAEGNFAQMLGLTKLLAMRKTGAIGVPETVMATLLGLIMTVIALIVVAIITLVLVFRIIILWFLVLLSPLVFVAQVLPATQGYAGMWWKKFTSQLIVGPVLAFMLWLSLAVVQEKGDIYNSVVIDTQVQQQLTGKVGEKLSATVSQIGKPQYVLNFIIGIAMLLGSLMIAQQLGVAGGSVAGQAMSRMQKFAKGTPLRVGKGVGRWAAVSKPGRAVRAGAETGRITMAKVPMVGRMFMKEGEKKQEANLSQAAVDTSVYRKAKDINPKLAEEKKRGAMSTYRKLFDDYETEQLEDFVEKGEYKGQRLNELQLASLMYTYQKRPDSKLDEETYRNWEEAAIKADMPKSDRKDYAKTFERQLAKEGSPDIGITHNINKEENKVENEEDIINKVSGYSKSQLKKIRNEFTKTEENIREKAETRAWIEKDEKGEPINPKQVVEEVNKQAKLTKSRFLSLSYLKPSAFSEVFHDKKEREKVTERINEMIGNKELYGVDEEKDKEALDAINKMATAEYGPEGKMKPGKEGHPAEWKVNVDVIIKKAHDKARAIAEQFPKGSLEDFRKAITQLEEQIKTSKDNFHRAWEEKEGTEGEKIKGEQIYGVIKHLLDEAKEKELDDNARLVRQHNINTYLDRLEESRKKLFGKEEKE